ncbi:hypothetical protein, partial [Streptomonospora sediminis]
MSHPSQHPLRRRRAARRRRYGLELLLGLVVLAAGTGLLVLDRHAPGLSGGESGSAASKAPPPAGGGA